MYSLSLLGQLPQSWSAIYTLSEAIEKAQDYSRHDNTMLIWQVTGDYDYEFRAIVIDGTVYDKELNNVDLA